MNASRQLGALLKEPGRLREYPDCAVRALRSDSREVGPGDVFFAREGACFDGRRFIDAACEAGAAAAVYEGEGELERHPSGAWLVPVADLPGSLGRAAARFYGHPSHALMVIGVTGTNGKTSVSHIVARAMAQIHGTSSHCAVLGTLGHGSLDRLEPASLTTPDSISVHRQLADMKRAGVRQVVMEVSSHALDQGRVAEVRFKTAVFTNLSRDHLDYHRDMAAYGRSKRRLFETEDLGFAVVNLNDSFGRSLLAKVPEAVRLLCHRLAGSGPAPEVPGFRSRLEVTGRLVRADASGLEVAIHTPWGEGVVRSPLLGRFNAENLLAALAVLLTLDVSLDRACRALSTVKPVAGRMQCLGGRDCAPLVVIDYAHTPDALEGALRALREQSRGRVWCVFGCGGDRDPGKRPQMGAVASKLADCLVITDDNPRSEDGWRIIEDIRTGIADTSSVRVERDRGEALRFAMEHASSEDVVLVAGKGHETWQEVGGVRRPFSDEAEVSRLLARSYPSGGLS